MLFVCALIGVVRALFVSVAAFIGSFCCFSLSRGFFITAASASASAGLGCFCFFTSAAAGAFVFVAAGIVFAGFGFGLFNLRAAVRAEGCFLGYFIAAACTDNHLFELCDFLLDVFDISLDFVSLHNEGSNIGGVVCAGALSFVEHITDFFKYA